MRCFRKTQKCKAKGMSSPYWSKSSLCSAHRYLAVTKLNTSLFWSLCVPNCSQNIHREMLASACCLSLSKSRAQKAHFVMASKVVRRQSGECTETKPHGTRVMSGRSIDTEGASRLCSDYADFTKLHMSYNSPISVKSISLPNPCKHVFLKRNHLSLTRPQLEHTCPKYIQMVVLANCPKIVVA